MGQRTRLSWIRVPTDWNVGRFAAAVDFIDTSPRRPRISNGQILGNVEHFGTA